MSELKPISLPQLQDIDWRIDIKSASETISRMSVPTVLLGLKIEETQKKVNAEPETNSLTFELNMEALQTMIDGLRFVEGQISNLAE